MPDRIQRITEMEQHLNRILVWNAGDHSTKDTIQEDVRLLDEYYKSPLWREDFEADEAGELPKDLQRGILSEDGIYNALEEYENFERGRKENEILQSRKRNHCQRG